MLLRNICCLGILAGWIGLYAEPGDIIAQWDFRNLRNCPGTYPLKIRGQSKLVAEGLQIHNPDMNKAGGAVTVHAGNVLTPVTPFSVEVIFTLSPGSPRPQKMHPMLLDNKYVARPDKTQNQSWHRGFMLYLQSLSKDQYRPAAAFGFGQQSSQVFGSRVTLLPGQKHSLSMLFTGCGKISFAVNGKSSGSANVPLGMLARSSLEMVLGDRVGAYYWPLGGILHQVTIKEEPYKPLNLMHNPLQRKVFERGEKACRYGLLVSNASLRQYADLNLKICLAGKKLSVQKISILLPSSQKAITVPFDGNWLPGDYDIDLRLEDSQGKVISILKDEVTIVKKYGNFMPVILWGSWNRDEVAATGFTHQYSYVMPWQSRYHEEDNGEVIGRLDACLKKGLYLYGGTDFRPWYKKFPRKDRQGKPRRRGNFDVSNPEVQKICKEVVEEMARGRGEHPGWDAALICTEQRDGTNISFSGFEQKNFRKFSGMEIPGDIDGKYPRDFRTTPDFPWNRVIPHDDLRIVFYRWFWKKGDGWNDLCSLLSEALHKNIKHHFFTWHDPAVRVPPIWGSGGKVDVISQWSYTYPDPIKIGQATDEVIAMSEGKPGQKIMKMTQIIWYRSQVAPKGQKVENSPEWLSIEKDASFITIAPDFLRSALWCKLSRRLDGIMYHGTGSLFGNQGGYKFTNGTTKKVLKEMLHKVVKPLGPVLKCVPERESDVAILESFTSAVYASRHFAYGWSNGWAADLHLALQWGHFQPSIIYEEHLLEKLDYKPPKVLFIPGVEVITDKLLAKLQELQAQGMILIGDEFTAPAIMLNYRLHSWTRRQSKPREDKLALQKIGKEIAHILRGRYVSPIHASNQDLIVRRRGNDRADYIFVLNDKRTFGDYVGQWGLVMEKGLPNQGTVTVGHEAKYAYDLLKHQEISVKCKRKQVCFDVSLGPGDGTIVLLLNQEILKPEIKLNNLQRGKNFKISMRILDKNQSPIQAYMPVQVTLEDAAGNELPGSGYYALHNGELIISEVAAPNMALGEVKARIKCLASGKISQTTVQAY